MERERQRLCWSQCCGRTEAGTVVESVPRTGGETRLKGHLDGCTKDYTVVGEEHYCELDGSRIVSGLKCLALVDIQGETEFPETLTCVCICPAEAGARMETLW